MELKSIPQTLGVQLSGKEESYVPPMKTPPGHAGKMSLPATRKKLVSHGKRSVITLMIVPPMRVGQEVKTRYLQYPLASMLLSRFLDFGSMNM